MGKQKGTRYMTCPNCGHGSTPRRYESVETKEDAQGCFVLLKCERDECGFAETPEYWDEQQ